MGFTQNHEAKEADLKVACCVSVLPIVIASKPL